MHENYLGELVKLSLTVGPKYAFGQGSVNPGILSISTPGPGPRTPLE